MCSLGELSGVVFVVDASVVEGVEGMVEGAG